MWKTQSVCSPVCKNDSLQHYGTAFTELPDMADIKAAGGM